MIVDLILLTALASSLYALITMDMTGVMLGLFLVYAALEQISYE
jgi:hypothetical protein